MIYHFVPFDMRYWNLILHQYKWYIASRQKKGCGLQKEFCKCLFTPHSLFFVKLYCTPVERHKRNVCLFFSPLDYQLWYVCFKKKDNLKCWGRKSPAHTGTKTSLALKKRRVFGGRRNMTAVAEGDVTYCQGLWHDSLVRWNPTGDIQAVSSMLGAEKRLLL